MRRFTSLLPTVGHVDYTTGAIEGMNLKESIIGIESAIQRVVIELFPKIRFGRAELFLLKPAFLSSNPAHRPDAPAPTILT
jgi:hypothetical protein